MHAHNPPLLRVPRLQSAKTKREAIGVELYGFQQNLAKLQLQLEQSHQQFQAVSRTRTQVGQGRV